jgi:hypothetical protein
MTSRMRSRRKSCWSAHQVDERGDQDDDDADGEAD